MLVALAFLRLNAILNINNKADTVITNNRLAFARFFNPFCNSLNTVSFAQRLSFQTYKPFLPFGADRYILTSFYLIAL